MSYPFVFANDPAGNNPASQLDTMFNIAGQQGNIPCTATGTNAITLTSGTNYYVPSAYTNAQIFSFKAVATSNGSVTIQNGGLAFIKLFTAAGVQAGSGDVVLNSHYAVQYWSDLDSGNGACIILNATVTAIANPVVGSHTNLVVTVTSNTQATVTADAVVTQNGAGGTTRQTAVSLTLNTGTSGANGLDTGSVAASKWYAVYVIFNAASSTVAGLLSLSASSPTLPSGYTYFARLGWVATDTNTFLLRTIQKGNQVQYVVTATASTTSTGGNTPSPIIIAHATAGTYSSTSPVLASATVQGNGFAVPTTAGSINIVAMSNWKAGGTANVLLAPNVNYGGTNNGPTGSNGQIYPVWIRTAAQDASLTVTLNLESSAVGWSTDAPGGAIACLGFTDNI